MLYGENVFPVNAMGDTRHSRFAVVSPSVRTNIRKVEIDMSRGFRGCLHNYPVLPFPIDPTSWETVLDRPHVMTVVVDTPQSVGNTLPVDHEKALEAWREWIMALLIYLDRVLPLDTQLIVNVNKAPCTTKIMDTVLPAGCHSFSMVPSADCIFGRGPSRILTISTC